MIYHPKSPFKGQHYRHPVELIDIYPTLLDISGFPFMLGVTCPPGIRCRILSGQSLAPVIFGSNFTKFAQDSNISTSLSHKQIQESNTSGDSLKMPLLTKRYALTQVIRCARRDLVLKANDPSHPEPFLSRLWDSCGPDHRDNEVSLMGYSLRTRSFRYTAYLPFDRRVNKVYNLTAEGGRLSLDYVSEELYDHREDHTHSLIDREMVNLANSSKYLSKVQELRLA
jgi:hypothetical protein